jgi:type I restriction enzyme S subunit
MMANGWRTVPFSEVLKVVSRPETLDRDKTYRILGMRWYAQGLFIREDKPGHEIQANELFRVDKDDFVYNRLFAWKGSFGIVDDTTAGGYVSGEFPCFHVITEKADPKFIHLYLSQEPIWNEIARVSSGQTNISRLRLKVPTFLAMEIPLPPLTEQRRIVRRIEELAERVAEAQSLREEAEKEINRMLLSPFLQISEGAQYLPMQDVAPLVRRPISVDVSKEYFELGVRSFGKGTFHKPPLNGALVGSKRIFMIEPGDLIFSNVFAWEGGIAVAQPEDKGRVGSHRFITCVPKKGLATAPYLCFYFLTKEGLEKIGSASPGGAGRNRTLGLEALAKILVPVPDISKQLWFDRLQTQVSTLRGLQAENQKELDALMPSILDKAFKGEL